MRVAHPVSLSRIIFTITEKANEVSAVYIIDTTRPDTICRVRVSPKRNPKFHKKEIEVGVGKSSRDFFIMFVMGLIFIICLFIKRRCLSFGMGCGH